jgi:hypothetical protein
MHVVIGTAAPVSRHIEIRGYGIPGLRQGAHPGPTFVDDQADGFSRDPNGEAIFRP